uniref:Uncharacterized protein n=1 Tax=Streptomyces rochei TaxID=1928 RepID=Q83WX1_STRRO|nr:hypothetical protein [Streptomyces rochei]BAC76594.2 hypothetical protein [Streptomyces rochei]BAK19910.1 hypothetical protein [Streptomyces rochei]
MKSGRTSTGIRIREACHLPLSVIYWARDNSAADWLLTRCLRRLLFCPLQPEASRGTTTVLRTLTAQFLHHGAHALVLDLKRISHWRAHGLPGVTYCRDITDIHDALIGLQAELAHHIYQIDQHGYADDLPRLTVLIEAADNTLNHLARHWDTVREKGDLKTSPAIAALEDLLFAGRQARIHILMAGHLKRPLGLEAREFFATLVLGRATTRTWNQLAPQIGATPKGSTRPGRVHVAQGLTAHPTPVLLMTDAEAAAWVTTTAAGETEED